MQTRLSQKSFKRDPPLKSSRDMNPTSGLNDKNLDYSDTTPTSRPRHNFDITRRSKSTLNQPCDSNEQAETESVRVLNSLNRPLNPGDSSQQVAGSSSTHAVNTDLNHSNISELVQAKMQQKYGCNASEQQFRRSADLSQISEQTQQPVHSVK